MNLTDLLSNAPAGSTIEFKISIPAADLSPVQEVAPAIEVTTPVSIASQELKVTPFSRFVFTESSVKYVTQANVKRNSPDCIAWSFDFNPHFTREEAVRRAHLLRALMDARIPQVSLGMAFNPGLSAISASVQCSAFRRIFLDLQFWDKVTIFLCGLIAGRNMVTASGEYALDARDLAKVRKILKDFDLP